jgi:flagellar motor switch protein FliN/FliY
MSSTATPYELRPFTAESADEPFEAAKFPARDAEVLLDIELGRAELALEDAGALREGSVVTLDKLAGDPVDILAGDRLIARGEVLVIDGKFCVRIAEVLFNKAAAAPGHEVGG